MQQRGVTPTTATYSTLIKCSATRGDVKSAEVWFQRIGEAGLVPDTQSYNNVLAARADVPSSACLKWEFPKTEVPYFMLGVLIIRILLFRVPY
ncbi:unnamed protein product [Symbiodinium sp. KB8]|nr:unnamed protein product [Symbiodinium sp. KB8]